MRTTLAALLALVVAASPAAALDVGVKAPKLRVATWIKGRPVRLSAGKGKKVYVVEFWATWCPPCRTSIPHLSKLQAKYKDKGLVVIGISREPVGTVRSFVRKMRQMNYWVACDRKNATSQAYMKGIRGIPHAFIVDRQGKIAWHGHPMSMDAALDRIVNQGPASVDSLQKQLKQTLAQALDITEEMIKLDPKNSEYQRTKTRLLRFGKTGRKKAVKTPQQKARDAKNDPQGLTNLAYDLAAQPDFQARDPELALKCIQEALRLTESKDPMVLEAAPASSTISANWTRRSPFSGRPWRWRRRSSRLDSKPV